MLNTIDTAGIRVDQEWSDLRTLTDADIDNRPQVARVKLAIDQEAPQLDPLGRDRIGYRAGLSDVELWERGRGVWKFKPVHIAACSYLLVTFDGIVRLAGRIDGITFHGDRIAVVGKIQPDAWSARLRGQADPYSNRSSNPVAYGNIRLTHSLLDLSRGS